MLNSLDSVLSSLSIVLNTLYLFWICNAAYNIVCFLTTSLSNRPKKHRNIKRKRKKKKNFCKIKQKLSCFRTAEEGVKNKACNPLLKPLHSMFHLCCYLCKLLFLSQNPGFPCMLPPNDYLPCSNIICHCIVLRILHSLQCRHPEGMNYKI